MSKKHEEEVKGLYKDEPELYADGITEMKNNKRRTARLARYLIKHPTDAVILGRFLNNGYLLHELTEKDLSALSIHARIWLKENGYTNYKGEEK